MHIRNAKDKSTYLVLPCIIFFSRSCLSFLPLVLASRSCSFCLHSFVVIFLLFFEVHLFYKFLLHEPNPPFKSSRCCAHACNATGRESFPLVCRAEGIDQLLPV